MSIFCFAEQIKAEKQDTKLFQKLEEKFPESEHVNALKELWKNSQENEDSVRLREHIRNSIIVFLSVILIAYLLTYGFVKAIQENFELLYTALQPTAEKISLVPIAEFSFTELKKLASSINFLIVEKILKPCSVQEDYRALFNTMCDGFAMHQMIYNPKRKSNDYRFIYVNPSFEKLTNLKAEALIGKTVFEVLPDLEQSWVEMYQKVAQSQEPLRIDKYTQSLNRYFRVTAYSPHPGYFACIFTDITEAKKAEERLIKSEIHYKQMVEGPMVYICRWTPDTTLTYVNKTYAAVHKKQPEQLIGTKWLDLSGIQERDKLKETYRDLVEHPRVWTYESQIQIAYGNFRWILWSDNPIFDDQGHLLEFESIGQDITDRKIAEESLRASERMLAIKNQIAHIFLVDPEDKMYNAILNIVLKVLQSPYGLFGFLNEQNDLVIPAMSSEMAIESKISENKKMLFPHEHWSGIWGQALNYGHIFFSNEPVSVPEGHAEIERAVSVPIIQAGLVIGLFMVANKPTNYNSEDINLLEEIANSVAPILAARLERDRQETRRRKMEQRLDQAQAIIKAAIWESPVPILIAENPGKPRENSGKLRFANRAACEIRGRPQAELVNINLEEHGKIWQIYTADGSSLCPQEKLPLVLGLREGVVSENVELIIRNERGENRSISVNAGPIRNKDGAIVAAIAIFLDITKNKAAEAEQRRLQDQLAHSKKMESIGRLAAGVAHDFNNLLSVIIGYAELLLENDRMNEIMRKSYTQEIKNATERGKRLTGQLLAFGRKQKLKTQIISLNQIIQAFQKMLTRLVREDIEVVYQLEPSLGIVRVDPSQIEQVLMNLAVNARDAMPKAGKLVIQTTNVEVNPEHQQIDGKSPAKKYICLSVSDTGCGMDELTLRQLFEPFFTTKEAGNGLGLATVYGIVKQHGGEIYVQSALNQGTTFRMYLPQVDELPASHTDASMTVEAKLPLPKLTGMILLVEDEVSLRQMLAEVLMRQGANVISAPSSKEAIRLAFERRDQLDLLFTDIVMPEIDGVTLANRVSTFCPNLPVLYMSGHTEEILAQYGISSESNLFLQKPITHQTLIEKVAYCLELKKTNMANEQNPATES